MGTYMMVVLKDTNEEHIKKVNSEINAMGYEPETFEGIEYGAFVTMAQLTEDARYMNEDPEGLTQCPHFKRPVKPMYLSNNFPWLQLGCVQIKLSASEKEQLEIAMIIAEWVRNNNDLIDRRASDNYRVSFVLTYLDI